MLKSITILGLLALNCTASVLVSVNLDPDHDYTAIGDGSHFNGLQTTTIQEINWTLPSDILSDIDTGFGVTYELESVDLRLGDGGLWDVTEFARARFTVFGNQYSMRLELEDVEGGLTQAFQTRFQFLNGSQVVDPATGTISFTESDVEEALYVGTSSASGGPDPKTESSGPVFSPVLSSVQVASIPEPSSAALIAVGACAALVRRKRA